VPVVRSFLISRHQLRSRRDLDIEQFLDGPGHLEIAPELLKLYLWTLRAMYLPGDEETREDVVKLRKIAAVVRRHLESILDFGSLQRSRSYSQI